MKYLLPLLPVSLAAVLCCCQQQLQPKNEEPTRQTPTPQYLGTVHQVYSTQKFALLRIIGPVPAPGTTLISHPADGSTERMGNLIVAEDAPSRNGMIVADIRSGAVVGGDRIFLYRNIAPPDLSSVKKSTPAPQPTPAADAATGSELPPPAAPVHSSLPIAPVSSRVAEPAPQPASQPTQAPSYLDSIPDDLSQWD